jgi:hypothetical protein
MPAPDKPVLMHLDPRQFWLPVTAVIVIVGTVITAVWSVAGWKRSLDDNTVAVNKLEQKMDALLEHSIGMRLWVAALAAKNPSLVVPDLPK